MPIITIFGATGAQGGAVLEAVLADGKYTPRAVSRNVDSAASKALIAKGIEVVSGNLSDVESLKKAIQGSEAVFGVTNFWDPEVFPADPKGKLEITQGKNLVDASKAVGVKFFIFSSLPNITKETNGKFTHVYHYDNKAVIEDYLKQSGLPYASLLTCWFLDNLWKFGSLTKTDTGSYNIAIPKFENTDVQDATFTKDIGHAAVGLLTHYKDASKGVVGGAFPVVSAQFTYPDFAAAIGKALKKEVTFTSLPTGGMAEFDEMARSSFTYQAKVRAYKDTPFPNPKLVALGVKFDSLEGFIQKEVVSRFA